MKRYILYIIACISLCSCSEVGDIDDVIILKELLNDNAKIFTVSPETMTFEANGGQQELTIKSNSDWTIVAPNDWCSVSTHSGSGTEAIQVTALQNTSFDERFGEIIVSNGETTVTISVSQKAAETSGVPGSGDNRPPTV